MQLHSWQAVFCTMDLCVGSKTIIPSGVSFCFWQIQVHQDGIYIYFKVNTVLQRQKKVSTGLS